MLNKKYKQLLKDNDFRADTEQEKAVQVLENLLHELQAANKKSFFSFKKNEQVQGVYLYGGVGRGKSMLMDLFFDTLSTSIKKRRVHFHEFMIETHDWLHDARAQQNEDTDDLLMGYARYVSKGVKVLCFDEFHVTDVADAMILGRLFTALFERGVVVVSTSNWAPDDLYEGGLNRQLFLPFIKFLKQYMSVVHLDSDRDYRTLSAEGGHCDYYLHPLNQQTMMQMDEIFSALTAGAETTSESFEVKGRVINVPSTANNIARFRFDDLCAKALGAEDYIEIANRYEVVFLENVPQLGSDKRNEAKRFILLIDCLYEAGTLLRMSTQSHIDNIYLGHDHEFEFSRTLSRLKEMNNVTYQGKGKCHAL